LPLTAYKDLKNVIANKSKSKDKKPRKNSKIQYNFYGLHAWFIIK